MYQLSLKLIAAGVLLMLLGSCTTASIDEAVAGEPSGPPDLNGLWQAMGTAHWNLEGGSAQKGPATGILGALGGISQGQFE